MLFGVSGLLLLLLLKDWLFVRCIGEGGGSIKGGGGVALCRGGCKMQEEERGGMEIGVVVVARWHLG